MFDFFANVVDLVMGVGNGMLVVSVLVLVAVLSLATLTGGNRPGQGAR